MNRHNEDEPDSKPVKKTERSNIIKQSKIENAIIEIIQRTTIKAGRQGLVSLEAVYRRNILISM